MNRFTDITDIMFFLLSDLYKNS